MTDREDRLARYLAARHRDEATGSPAARMELAAATRALNEHDVDLCVLNPTGMFFNQHCVQMEHARDGGTWHWPERES